MVSDVDQRIKELKRAPQIVMLVAGSREEFERFAQIHPAESPYLHQADWSVSENYRIKRTPSGVLIDKAGSIVAPTAVGWSGIEQLLIRGSKI